MSVGKLAETAADENTGFLKAECEIKNAYGVWDNRFYLVDSISNLKRKVIALMDQVFPEYSIFLSLALHYLLVAS